MKKLSTEEDKDQFYTNKLIEKIEEQPTWSPLVQEEVETSTQRLSSHIVGTSDINNGSHEEEEEEEQQLRKKPNHDPLHWIAGVCFVSCTTFWLAALFLNHPQPFLGILNAFITLVICFILDVTVACIAPHFKARLVLMHFSLGVLQNMTYIILFIISPTGIFEEVWTSVYFGYYLWTWIMMLAQKNQFFYMFRVFYTIHHTISFFITGSWLMVTPCCINDEKEFIYRGIVLWLSADLWNYGLNVYRSLKPETSKDKIHTLQVIVFIIERIHRSTAYFQALTVPSSYLNTLAWVVFGTGLFNDILDASFQLRSLCQYDSKRRKQKVQLPSQFEPSIDQLNV